jgi:hypothetical protein
LAIEKTKKMTEVINHIFGTCGENHPHVFNLSALGIGIIGYFSYIKFKIKSIFLWKNKNRT